jgi:cytochrome c oxidase cbb3-type subunit 3
LSITRTLLASIGSVWFAGCLCLAAQAPTPAPAPPVTQGGGQPIRKNIGGFVPGQKRQAEDPAKVSRGKTLFEINCRGCHGADLRGGDLGGPNLLRSQVALADQNGELIVPIIHGSREKMGMPAIGLNDDDANAVAAYVRSVMATIGVQGTPPAGSAEAPNVLVGNAAEGKAYFSVKCGNCHSATGDLRGLAGRISDPKKLQTTWVAGGNAFEEARPGSPGPRAVIATVTFPSGEKLEGPLVHIDDFLVTVQSADGTQRSIIRTGNTPEVALRDPMKRHRELLSEYTDKDMHDVTAYLATLK